MQLASPQLTTTRTKKRNKKKSQRDLDANKRHQDYLRSMGVHPEQLKAKAKKAKDAKDKASKPAYNADTVRRHTASASSMQGVGAKKEPMIYNGERKLLGIATMHKSNMVPVFDKGNAEELAKMRRN